MKINIITTFRSFTLYTWVLFILLMQSVSGAQFLNIALLFLLSNSFAALSAATGPQVIIIVPFTSMYTSQQSHKLDKLNQIWMVELVYCLRFFFLTFHYYINFRSSITYCLFSREIFFGILVFLVYIFCYFMYIFASTGVSHTSWGEAASLAAFGWSPF